MKVVWRKTIVLNPSLGYRERPAQATEEPKIVLHEPTAAELATNFAGAMARWAGDGFPVVSEQTYAARTAACEACELWDGTARFGLGICKAPGCGCTRYKRWLATETCKHPAGSRWKTLTPVAEGSPAEQAPDPGRGA